SGNGVSGNGVSGNGVSGNGVSGNITEKFWQSQKIAPYIPLVCSEQFSEVLRHALHRSIGISRFVISLSSAY
ncbi:MAG TPA: hypothetical protein PLQ57_15950, partial [Saprospiraceae bacterium]|nr:hypothetical protein [Saprospiraceae bacterium]